MYEIEKRWYEGIRAGQSGGRGAASFREIRRWRVLFSPSSPPPKIRKLSVFPSVSALPPLPGRLPAPASLDFRVGQKKARSRKCEGSTPRRDATRDGREREKQSPPPPKQRRSPLLSRSLSLSLSCLLPKLSLTRRPAPPSPPAPLLALSLLDLQGVTPSCAYSRSSQKQERKKTNRKASKSSDFFLPLSVSSLSLFSLHRFPPCSFHGAAALPSSTALSAARA